MNEQENEIEVKERSRIAEFFLTTVDRKYYWGFGIGLIVLIITLILIAIYRGSTKWLDILIYPLLVYFIFQQVLSGFGFITGYIPLAQDIINWLTKISKKKAYSEKDIEKIEKEHEKIEDEERKETKKIKEELAKIDKKEEELSRKEESGRWSERKIKREKARNKKKRIELEEDRKEIEDNYSKEKKKLKEKQKQYRGKITEKVITKQEELDPRQFKLIMLLPIYIMMAIGIVLTLIGFISPIVRWAEIGIDLPIIDRLDQVNEIYKGIVAIWGIINFFIIPTIRIYRDPTREYIPRFKEEKKRRFQIFRRRKKDPRTVLNRQFEDLRKYYWDIKMIIRKALFIPIGFSMLIAAPIGGDSIILGIKTAIRRKEMEKYELILQIVIAVILIVMVGLSYFFFIARQLKNIHPMMSIILKIIYGSFLVYSFILFTRQPIAQKEEK
ncbi:MAG: hypothetical protein FK732_05690 [Asgard group archaeon]|nr:hypothetical protein [Asgard group archaeon]